MDLLDYAECSHAEARARLRASVGRWKGGLGVRLVPAAGQPDVVVAYVGSEFGSEAKCAFSTREPAFDWPDGRLDEMVHARLSLAAEC